MYFRKCENMRKMILKRSGNDYQIEIWGTSTKHPDFISKYRGYIEKEWDDPYKDFATIDDTFIQWVAWIASHQIFQQHSIQILNAGMEIYLGFPKDEIPRISDILKTHVIEWEDHEIYGIEIKV